MGVDLQVMRNLEVVQLNKDANVVLGKGSVPEKSAQFLCIKESSE